MPKLCSLQKSKYCGEVPATKLAALQKVLQSEFLNAVREVTVVVVTLVVMTLLVVTVEVMFYNVSCFCVQMVLISLI